MKYFIDEQNKFLIELFLIPEIFEHGSPSKVYGYLYLKDTDYYIHYDIEGKFSYFSWYDKSSGKRMTFQEIFETVSDQLKKELIYYLDLLDF